MFRNLGVIVVLFFLLSACQTNETIPKPKAQISLNYPQPNYQLLTPPCPFSFEISNLVEAKIDKKCWVTLNYPLLNASIDITFKPVNNNLIQLLQDAEKLTYSHTIKADGISNQPFINNDKKIFATIYQVSGNAASQLQFHATDSLSHFLTGALYFNCEPNYDSILPAVKYIETDLRHLIETINWK